MIVRTIFIFLFYFVHIFYVNSLTMKGNFIEGGLVIGQVTPLSKVELDGKKVYLSSEGYFIIGFHRDSPERSILVIRDPNGQIIKKNLEIEQRKYNTQIIDGLPKNKVIPPEHVWERIKKEALEVKNARMKMILEPYYLSGFDWPVKGTITGVYGSQRILNGKPRRPHYGIDIAGKIGTNILSTSDGVVIYKAKDLYFSGGTLIIGHGQGLTSTYLHLETIGVEIGQIVKKGQKIATMGASGRVTGPHLDWRMELNGARIDPQLLVVEMIN